MIAKLGTLRRYQGDWWDKASATCLCAYQAKQADSAALAKVDLTGNGYDLTGADPAWTAADGFTTAGTAFDTISGLSLPDDISVIWAGTVLYSNSGGITLWNNSVANWLGLIMHCYTGPEIYCGYGATSSSTVSVHQTVDNDTACVFCFQKTKSTGNHKLFQDGVSKYDAVPANNADASNLTARLYTGNGGFWGAAIYNGILNQTDITAISDYLNGL